MKRRVYFISDGTGITAEALGNTLLTQFGGTGFHTTTIPYVDNIKKAQQAIRKINQASQQRRPIVFTTLVDPSLRNEFKACNAKILDLFATFLSPLEAELGTASSYVVGKSHGVDNFELYQHRIEAVNYTLGHDDGIRSENYNRADLILIGVSRCGKTPSCLYLALQFGILAANYPLTEDDLLHHYRIPEMLQPYKKKLFGLTIQPERLRAIRQERRPNSQYASLEQCRKELSEVEALYQQEKIPFLNTTHYSVEEIATLVLAKTGVRRRVM